MALDSLEGQAKEFPRYKKILEIVEEVSNKTYDAAAHAWKREIKSQYKELYNQLMKKEKWFRNNYGQID